MHEGAAILIDVSGRSALSHPRQLIGGAGLLELQKETAQVTHTLRRVDVWLSPPREEMAMHSR